jgi:hypothetical protein
MGTLTCCFSLRISPSDTITFNAVQNAVSAELTSGDAKQALRNICEINHPATKTYQHSLEQYYKMKCKIQINGSQS